METTELIIAWCALSLLCGGLIKGSLGVGTPLLTVPMLSLVIPLQSAITIMCIPILVANLVQAWQAPRDYPVVNHYWLTGLALVIGSLIGTSALSSLDDRVLLIVIGSIVICFALLQSSGRQRYLPVHLTKPVGILAGLISGIIGGLSSMYGPVFVMYLMSLQELDKNRFVAVASFLYLCAVIPWPLELAWHGLLNKQTLSWSLLAVVPVYLGLILGTRIRHRVSESQFRGGLITVLLLSGISLLWRAW